MKSIRSSLTLLLLALLTALTVFACSGRGNNGAPTQVGSNSGGGNNDTPIQVASKDFTEEFILGEMYALVLENNGLKVERKMNLGGTPVAQAGLVSGKIDLYPEYTGTGLLTVLKLPPSSNQQQVFDTVSKGYKQKFNLVWLQPAPMNDSEGFAMTQQGSQKYGVKTISDMVAKGSQLTLIAPSEFQEREDGLPGIKKAYGDPKLKKLISADPGLRYPALLKGEADVTEAFTTDGEISAYHLVVLKDDKHFYPPYQVAPVVRQQALDAHPGIRDALNGLAPKITNEVMQRLNYEVSGKKREPAEVAKEFLTQAGVLKKT